MILEQVLVKPVFSREGPSTAQHRAGLPFRVDFAEVTTQVDPGDGFPAQVASDEFACSRIVREFYCRAAAAAGQTCWSYLYFRLNVLLHVGHCRTTRPISCTSFRCLLNLILDNWTWQIWQLAKVAEEERSSAALEQLQTCRMKSAIRW